jgi:hypothetical protein
MVRLTADFDRLKFSVTVKGWSKRDSLPRVLVATRRGSLLDILVHLGSLEQ